MPTLRVRQSEFQFVAAFERPIFHLWAQPPSLFTQLHNELGIHGFRATDLRWEQGVGAMDARLVFHLSGFRLTVKLRVDQLDVQAFDLAGLQPESTADAVLGILKALQAYSGDLRFAAYTLGLALHGTLDGQSVSTFLTDRVKAPPDPLGAMIGTGCVYYFGRNGNRLSMAVTLDSSAAVGDGLFLKVASVWQPSEVSDEQFRQIASSYTEWVAGTFGLTLAF